MRILVVSPYPPQRDGIAAYAVQAVAKLREEGHDVEVLSPGPSAAHHHLDLVGPRGALALARRVRAYDKVIVQFHPDVFYPVPCPPGERARTSVALLAAFRAARDLEVVVHETDYTSGRGRGPAARAVRAMWRAVPRVVVHTDAERHAFATAFGVAESRITVTAHGSHFVRRAPVDRASARARLGIPADAFLFLSIGFLQPHKGFDRAIRAFAGLGEGGCRLDIVGSVRVEEPEYVGHVEELRRLAAATPGVSLHEGYVTDEEFDRWLAASDVVVLPYRHIWSSGVVERAALYDRPVIVTRVGGLAAQAGPHAVVVDTDAELADALRTAARGRLAGREEVPLGRWPAADGVDREAVMQVVRARAARRRGGPVVSGHDDGATRGTSPSVAEVSAPLRRLPALGVPAAVSARPGASALKRVVRRLTAWEVDPIVHQLNQLQRAMVEATERLAAERPADADRADADRADAGNPEKRGGPG